MKHTNQKSAAPVVEQANNAVEQTAPTTNAPAAKEKTPEQKAAAMRRQAGELRRSAEFAGEGKDALIRRAEQLEQDADALAPRKTKSSGEPRPTCIGTKKDGTPCTAKAMEGSQYCTDHRPVRARFNDSEWEALQAIPVSTWIELVGWGRAKKLVQGK